MYKHTMNTSSYFRLNFHTGCYFHIVSSVLFFQLHHLHFVLLYFHTACFYLSPLPPVYKPVTWHTGVSVVLYNPLHVDFDMLGLPHLLLYLLYHCNKRVVLGVLLGI